MRLDANTEGFIAEQKRYFEDAYKGFATFGGPSVYFHHQCLRAGAEEFLSERHVEMLYATLTAWGMHRMGDAEKTKTKLVGWDQFHDSLVKHGAQLRQFRGDRMLAMSESQYTKAISALRECYEALEVSESKATIVANSKTLHHLLPGLVPPIDRQYTIRFFRDSPADWRTEKGKLRTVQFQIRRDEQFSVFQEICVAFKRLADRVEPTIFKEQHESHRVDAPKALDNAVVNFVRIVVKDQKRG